MSQIQILHDSANDKQSFPWGRLRWFASRALGNMTSMTLGECRLKPGEGNPLHLHPNCNEVLIIISGEIEHTGPQGTIVEMKAGDTVTIPQGTPHCARNTGATDAVLFIAFDSADRETVTVETPS